MEQSEGKRERQTGSYYVRLHYTGGYGLEQRRKKWSRQAAAVDVGVGRDAAAVQVGELAAVVLGQDQEVVGRRQSPVGHELVGG